MDSTSSLVAPRDLDDRSGPGIGLQLMPDFQQTRELSVLTHPSSVIFILTPPQRRKVGMSVAIYALEFNPLGFFIHNISPPIARHTWRDRHLAFSCHLPLERCINSGHRVNDSIENHVVHS